MTVNGVREEHDVEPRLLLVHYLRDVLGLTGTNIGCDTTSCGACTVLIDGESVKSCTVLAVQADGDEITTIEGHGPRREDAPDPAGLPGEPWPSVRVLHARHGDGDRRRFWRRTPTRPRRRCGWGSRATSAGAPATTTSSRRRWPQPARLSWLMEQRADDGRRDRVRGPADGAWRTASGPGSLGTRQLRREDPALLSGEARFIDDLQVPGALHVSLVRSPYAHAAIRSVDLRTRSPARASSPPTPAPTSGRLGGRPALCVAGHRRHEGALHLPLAVEQVAYVGDAVAVVVAASATRRVDAAAAVVVDYDPLAAVIDLEAARSDAISCTPRSGRTSLRLGAHPRRRRRRAGLREGGPRRLRALRAAAAHPLGHGAAGRLRRARALRRRPHRLLRHADPPHPADHARGDDRGAGVDACASSPRRSVAGSARSSTSTPKSSSASCSHASSAGRSAGPRSGWRTPRPRSRAAARSRTSSSPPTPTASCSPSASSCSPTWVPTCSW